MTLFGLGFPILALVALLAMERLERRLGANPRQAGTRGMDGPGSEGTPGPA
jgi:hypothetical protein